MGFIKQGARDWEASIVLESVDKLMDRYRQTGNIYYLVRARFYLSKVIQAAKR